ncbi:MAG TPA: helix-turn-helix transcriptional regulator [Streptosporangiaceae bacterium]|jgi:transcriptional regulator with XRE-family HTH domain
MTAPRSSPSRERHWACAQRIRERRLALGLTQREVVDRLQRRGYQTTNRVLSAMENGRGLDIGMLPELADSLDCTVTYLLGLAADPHSWHPDQRARNGERAPELADRQAPERRHVFGVLGPVVPDVSNGFVAPGRRRGRRIPAEPAGGEPS